MKTILLIEEKPHIRENLIAIIDAHEPIYRVLTARNLLEATDVIDTLQIDVLMLAITLTPAEVKILSAHLKKSESTKLILIAEGKQPMPEGYADLEYAAVIKKPISPDHLIDALTDLTGTEHGGHIRGIHPTSFLQMLHLESKTGVISIQSGDRSGTLWVENGSLFSAETGDLTGKDAVLKMLAWDKPSIRVDYQPVAVKKNINESLMRIMLESSYFKDNKNRGAYNLRKHKRFECSQEVMFSIDDLIYRGVIRDVSLGGIYIESGIPLSTGKEIMLTIEDPQSMKPDFIFGKIVRSTDNGIGVEFSSLKDNQKKLLMALVQDANLTEAV